VYGRLCVGDGPPEGAGEVFVEVIGDEVVRSFDSKSAGRAIEGNGVSVLEAGLHRVFTLV